MKRYSQALAATPRLITYALRSDNASLDREIFELFSKLGGLYVKFLQILISNAHALKTLDHDKRMSVFSESKPSPLDHHRLMREQLGHDLLKKFAYIDDEPFSTGSFANVYRANLHEGGGVIVKVKRPGLEKQLAKDLRVIRFVAWVIDQFDTSGRYNIRNIAREYSEGIAREVDYESETDNASAIYEAYKGQDQIVIPITYHELCTPDIIVQEYLDGLVLSEVLKRPAEDTRQFVSDRLGTDLDKQMHILGSNFLDRSFSSLPVHGDPHPGNIILLPGGKVGMVDFGLIAQPAQDTAGYIAYMHEQSYINNGTIRPGKFGLTLLRTHSSGLYRSLAAIDRAMPDTSILRRMEGMMKDRFYANTESVPGLIHQMQGGQTNQIFESVMNPGNGMLMSFDMDGMMMLRANNIVWSTMIQLGVYRDIVPSIVEEAVARARSGTGVVGAPSHGRTQDLESAMESIGNWLDSVREVDPILFRTLSAIFPKNTMA